MSTLKRPFAEFCSTAPTETAGDLKRFAGSDKSFSQPLLDNEIDDEILAHTASEEYESGSKNNSLRSVFSQSYEFPSSKSNTSSSACTQDNFACSEESNSSDVEICYGMLLDSRFKLFRGAEPPANWAVADRDSPAFTGLSIRPCKADTMTILSPNRTEIGVLDKRTATVLRLLKSVSGSIRYSIFLGKEGDTDHNVFREKGVANTFPIEINVNGPLQKLQKVGEVLSDAGMFLQEPVFLDRGAVYRNPHFLSWAEENTTPLFARPENNSANSFAESIEEVMSCSSATFHPRLFFQDKRITTPLKRHQVDALQFMMAREGQLENDLSLWEPSIVNYRKAFVNKITRESRVKRPRECLGGILADEMGMGKSLALLTLIVHTLGQGHLAGQESNKEILSGESDEPVSRATLIVTPKSTLNNWDSEIKRHLSPDFRWSFYYGQRKSLEPRELAELDIVCTTYETVFHDTNQSATLQAVPWFRIVLDEAHHIRNRTKTFHAVMNLRSRRKWCLTATPVQNSLDDFFSLTEFLGLHPVENRTNARRWILDPLGSGDRSSIEKLGVLVRSATLRRSRDSERRRRRSEHEVMVVLSPTERELYSSIRSMARECLSAHDRLLYLLRMRQLCSHGLEARSGKLEDVAASAEVFQGPLVCSKCGESLSSTLSATRNLESSITPRICFECEDEQGDTANSRVVLPPEESSKSGQPHTLVSELDVGMLNGTCRDQIDIGQGHITSLTSEPSSKIRTVIENLLRCQQEHHEDGTPIKNLVFSVWTATLDVLERALSSHSVLYSRIDGSRSLEQRNAAIHNFKTDPDLRILLLTFGTGSVGLNLTPATHVHIVEPQWNPMVEIQAAARVDRLDQENDVVILRYIVEDSVEKLIRARQSRKIWLAKLTTSSSSVTDQADIIDDPEL